MRAEKVFLFYCRQAQSIGHLFSETPDCLAVEVFDTRAEAEAVFKKYVEQQEQLGIPVPMNGVTIEEVLLCRSTPEENFSVDPDLQKIYAEATEGGKPQ